MASEDLLFFNISVGFCAVSSSRTEHTGLQHNMGSYDVLIRLE